MSDLIRRDEVLNLVNKGISTDTYEDMEYVIELIKAIPTAEPMSDLISRHDAIQAIDMIEMSKGETWYDLYRKALTALNNIPTAEPKVGKWVEHPNHIERPYCKVWFLKDYMPRNSYCPNCGAKLERSE